MTLLFKMKLNETMSLNTFDEHQLKLTGYDNSHIIQDVNDDHFDHQPSLCSLQKITDSNTDNDDDPYIKHLEINHFIQNKDEPLDQYPELFNVYLLSLLTISKKDAVSLMITTIETNHKTYYIINMNDTDQKTELTLRLTAGNQSKTNSFLF